MIVYIDNPQGNNINEEYEQVDPTIPESASDRTYNFQGYQLYQVANEDVSVADLGDVTRPAWCSSATWRTASDRS